MATPGDFQKCAKDQEKDAQALRDQIANEVKSGKKITDDSVDALCEAAEDKFASAAGNHKSAAEKFDADGKKDKAAEEFEAAARDYWLAAEINVRSGEFGEAFEYEKDAAKAYYEAISRLGKKGEAKKKAVEKLIDDQPDKELKKEHKDRLKVILSEGK